MGDHFLEAQGQPNLANFRREAKETLDSLKEARKMWSETGVKERLKSRSPTHEQHLEKKLLQQVFDMEQKVRPKPRRVHHPRPRLKQRDPDAQRVVSPLGTTGTYPVPETDPHDSVANEFIEAYSLAGANPSASSGEDTMMHRYGGAKRKCQDGRQEFLERQVDREQIKEKELQLERRRLNLDEERLAFARTKFEQRWWSSRPPYRYAAVAADKPTTSGSSTKSQSPASTTSNLLGPQPRSGIFQCRPKKTAFSFSVRPYRTPDDCLPLLQPKRETVQTKAKPSGMTILRSHEVPESDLLGAKPEKPPRMTTTVKPERSASSTYSNASSSSKTFTSALPFRNNPRVYSSTVLKNFNVAGKQSLGDNTSGDRGHLVMGTPKRDSPLKQQRRPDRRVRYKAEIVGSNSID
ncbi:hypothetical protein IscW_ISCW006158 [Ixodes scapularis]|uniref:Uncharacterized protein n=1 Tax=Ixodes scapularis TaxID=6945 RepID=B7PQB6_IXOSC|nr:hypothetical protein IscW_ISCW006158 [Ixodes scapularis]|eukprot:XP_002435958.1 hypothetical protein IscW_ISCW006158 [Ixodes scapularis]